MQKKFDDLPLTTPCHCNHTKVSHFGTIDPLIRCVQLVEDADEMGVALGVVNGILSVGWERAGNNMFSSFRLLGHLVSEE